jgi:hypothetical protein
LNTVRDYKTAPKEFNRRLKIFQQPNETDATVHFSFAGLNGLLEPVDGL